MIRDFSPAAAGYLPDSIEPSPQTSTALAASYGLVGEWTWRPGAETLVHLLESTKRPWCSRLANPRLAAGWHPTQVVVVPAVRGRTAWPAGEAPAVLVETPNHSGVLEDLDEAGSHGPLGVILHPGLTGDLLLPPATAAVSLDFGAEGLSLSRGHDRTLPAAASAWTALDREARGSLARAATNRARTLAKMTNQLSGVQSMLGAPTSGRFVLETRRDPARVLEAMSAWGVVGGLPAGLPEFPGGIVVTCHAGHDEADLGAFVTALTAALT